MVSCCNRRDDIPLFHYIRIVEYISSIGAEINT